MALFIPPILQSWSPDCFVLYTQKHVAGQPLTVTGSRKVLFMNVNVGGLKSYLFYVRKMMKVVSRPWNMRIGSHRGPEWAFWAFFGVFWAFSTVFALLWLSERTYMIYILIVCTLMYYRGRFNRIRSKNHYYLEFKGPVASIIAIICIIWVFFHSFCSFRAFQALCVGLNIMHVC